MIYDYMAEVDELSPMECLELLRNDSESSRKCVEMPNDPNDVMCCGATCGSLCWTSCTSGRGCGLWQDAAIKIANELAPELLEDCKQGVALLELQDKTKGRCKECNAGSSKSRPYIVPYPCDAECDSEFCERLRVCWETLGVYRPEERNI